LAASACAATAEEGVSDLTRKYTTVRTHSGQSQYHRPSLFEGEL
jgi:hypothetical protein